MRHSLYVFLCITYLFSSARGDLKNLTCKQQKVEFLLPLDYTETKLGYHEDEMVVENIALDLAKVGVKLEKRKLEADAFNKARASGEFNLAFAETWGPPYDPQAYARSWSVEDEAYYGYFSSLSGLGTPLTKDVLNDKVVDATTMIADSGRKEAWNEILSGMHSQVTELPFAGRRVPAVLNKRLAGYTPGQQRFDYPLHSIRVLTGSRTITVSPGTDTGLFRQDTGVGALDAHTYHPNEYFANSWVYDGLVEYGPDGTILPCLAESWTVADRAEGYGQSYTFNLRQNVTFHDGALWNCVVAKLNFDHVLAKPLTTKDWHGWYGLPSQIDNWSCQSEYVFIVTTRTHYWPFLRELSFIRPLRMMSPKMFVGGLSSDPLTQNSCRRSWGSVTSSDYPGVTVTCAGIVGGGIMEGGDVSGTGRWRYLKTERDGSSRIKKVFFVINEGHWNYASLGTSHVQQLILVHYPDHETIKEALLANTLDAVVGSGVLPDSDLAEFNSRSSSHDVIFTKGIIQNRVIIFNTAKEPTNDIKTRHTIVHAINKAGIIKNVLMDSVVPVDGIFPEDSPYCDVHLTPRHDYDLEKAQTLSCPTNEFRYKTTNWPISTIVIVAVSLTLTFVACASLTYLVVREKRGVPVFKPIEMAYQNQT